MEGDLQVSSPSHLDPCRGILGTLQVSGGNDDVTALLGNICGTAETHAYTQRFVASTAVN